MIKTIKLNNGAEMPMQGFGVFQITDPLQCEQAVINAAESGYRLIGTASSCQNEEACGKAVKNSGIEHGFLSLLKLIYIKLICENAIEAFCRSRRKSGLDCLDLYLTLMPLGDYYISWRAMEELCKAEKVRAIEISKFARQTSRPYF